MFSFVFILKWPIKQRLSYCGPKLLWGPLPGPFLHWPVNVTVGGAVDLRCNTTEVHPSLPCSADVITALQKATDTLPRRRNSEAHLGAVRAAWRPEIYGHVEFWDSCPFDCVMVSGHASRGFSVRAVTRLRRWTYPPSFAERNHVYLTNY